MATVQWLVQIYTGQFIMSAVVDTINGGITTIEPTVAITSVQRRKWSPTENDPQTGNDPQIGPQMIPDVYRKWSRRKTRNGMEFVPPVEVSFF